MRYARTIALFLALLWASAAWAAPRTFVSAGSGDDANPCSRPLPCRSFVAALAATDADGEIIALDSGGYGPAPIARSVSIISPTGIYAAITAPSGNAITVNAGDTGRVILRNLALSGQGTAVNGIEADSVASLSIENCLINGFSNGVLFQPTTTNAGMSMNNGVIRRSQTTGVSVIGGTGLTATIDSVHFYDCATGVFAQSAQATVRKSVATGASNAGFLAGPGSKMTVEESVASGSNIGFGASLGFIIVVRSEATSNTYGLRAFALSAFEVSDSTIAFNTTGVAFDFMTATAGTSLNNTLQANTTDGTFNITYPFH